MLKITQRFSPGIAGMKAAGAAVRRSMQSRLEDFGEEVRGEMARRIESQELDVPALTVRYLRWKELHGHDRQIFMRTGEYVKNLHAGVVIERRSVKLVLGATGQQPITNTPYEYLAFLHEYGTRHQRPRPLYRPVGEWAMDRIPRLVEGIVADMAAAAERGR